MGCTIFASDFHIGPGLGLVVSSENPHTWEWLTVQGQRRLSGFLSWIAQRKDVDAVYLLGDIWDGWIIPHDVQPPTIATIMLGNQPLANALRSLSESKPTFYASGNHDQAVTAPLLAAVMPKAHFAGPAEHPFFLWGAGALRAEHGHASCLFNAPDPLRRDQLPLGYFLSRLAATVDRQTGSRTPGLARDIEALLAALATHEALPQGVLEAFCNKAGLTPDAQIQMPSDLWNGTPVSIAQVSATYENLCSEWNTRHGGSLASSALAITAELDGLALVAEKIGRPIGCYRGVVMGHTHHATTEPGIPLIGSIYANSGAWCSDGTPGTWVEGQSAGCRLELVVRGCDSFDASNTPKGLHNISGPVSI
ncbi:MAG: hypothetical protein ABSB49_04775 [Polyangia bacterium]